MQLKASRLGVRNLADKTEAVREILIMAGGIGFSEKACGEIALVASELTSNLVKHGGGGELIIQPVQDGARLGIRIETLDMGKGIRDPEEAIADGYTTSESLGYGLGTVNRLMDDLDIKPVLARQGGTHVTCQRWLREASQGNLPRPLALGGATRPMPGMKLNGDAFYLKSWGHSALVAAIDGVGHGQYANRAAQRASNYLESHYDQPLDKIFLGVSRECRITRGIVMALARFDWEPMTLTFASVGNITSRVFGAKVSLPLRRGIVGLKAPRPIVIEHPWNPENILVLHSDGVSTHWGLEAFPGIHEKSANETARILLGNLSRDHDDATVVVVKKAKKLQQAV